MEIVATITCTVLNTVLYDNNLSCRDRKICTILDVVPDDLNRRDRTLFGITNSRKLPQSKVPTGDRNKSTNKVHERGGNEGTVDSRNANKCDVLCVVHKGIEIKGVGGFKIANNQNGLACSDSKLYRMLGLVVDSIVG